MLFGLFDGLLALLCASVLLLFVLELLLLLFRCPCSDPVQAYDFCNKKIYKKSYKNNKHPYKYILYLSQRKKKNVLSVNIYLLQTCSNTLLLSSFSKSEVDPIPGDFCEQENNKFLGKGVCPALSHGLLFCSIAADANKFL